MKNILLHFGRLANAERTVNDYNHNNYYIVAIAHIPRRFTTTGRMLLYIYHYFVGVAANVRSGIFYYVYHYYVFRLYALDIINSRAQSIRSRVAVNDRETDLDIL